jgi:hypothetical protein
MKVQTDKIRRNVKGSPHWLGGFLLIFHFILKAEL